MMRTGLRMLIDSQKNWEVCGEAGNAREGLDAIMTLKPSLALVDIALPDKNGLELIKDIRAMEPGVRILAISSHDENLYAERALRAGARGYIMKEEASEVLVHAITCVLNDQTYISPRMTASLLESLSRQKPKNASPLKSLTDRELEIFTLIGKDVSYQDIADRLCISPRTVETHRVHIREKLNITDANKLIQRAQRWVDEQQIT
jgi:DNA-binding NarL/FixJ family response regulator